MKIGVLVPLTENIEEEFEKVYDYGMNCCQLARWGSDIFTPEMAERIVKASEKYGVEVTALWCGWEGPAQWNFYEGPLTLGLVPPEYRFQRMQTLMKGSDFAKMINVNQMITHVGYIPEVPVTVEYNCLVNAVRAVANKFKENGQHFLFETGQETPVTLKRMIEDVGTDNLGINLDSANLVCYGKANPVDALDVFGEYVMNTHIKDSLYPVNGRDLGEEVKVGEGKVDYPTLIKRLKELNYPGNLIIEREISGEQQVKDIKDTKIYLEKILADLN